MNGTLVVFPPHLCLNNSSMNPDGSPHLPAPSSLDYLNQIAAQPSRRRALVPTGSPMFWVLIAVAAIVVITIVSIVATTLSQKGSANIEALSARLAQLQTTVAARQNDIGNTDLATTNSSLGLNLTQLNNELDAILKDDGKNPSKLNGGIVAKETANTKDLTTTLDNAKLNALFDSTYASAMTYQLDTALATIHQMQKSKNGPKTTSFLSDADKDLSQARDSFASYDDTAL